MCIECLNVTIENGTFSHAFRGLVIYDSKNITIKNITSMKNMDGIYVGISEHIKIENVTSLENECCGIWLCHVRNVSIMDFIVENNSEGIIMSSYTWYSMFLNGVIRNNDIGITVSSYPNEHNTFTELRIENNEIGIRLSSKKNEIFRNEFLHNHYGIQFFGGTGTDNYIYLNNFNNTQNVLVSHPAIENFWMSPEPVTYIYNNTRYKSYLGNWWSDYTGNDSDNNGVGDEPYVMNEKNKDNYPLMEPIQSYSILSRVIGDVNGDGEITATDALLYLRFAVGLDISPYHLDPVADDLTGDGRITAVDALKVLRAAVGLITLT